ncbi:hypothetical protein D3C72_1801170 [compost metagenome]
MSRDRQRQLFCGNAAAVVADADQAHTAFFQFDVDAAGAGIDRVLNQFLDHRCGSFDHLTGGNLIDQDFRQRPDRTRIGRVHGQVGQADVMPR